MSQNLRTLDYHRAELAILGAGIVIEPIEPPRFDHYRLVVPHDGERVILPRGGATVCTVTYPRAAGGVVVRVGISVCAFADGFCRRLGRRIALGRANADQAPGFAYPLLAAARARLRGDVEQLLYCATEALLHDARRLHPDATLRRPY